MAPLRYAAKFDPFLSLDCAHTPSTLAQSKERKGSNFAIWQPCPQAPPPPALPPVNDMRSSLMEQIRAGGNLKHVEVERETKKLDSRFALHIRLRKKDVQI